MTKVTTYYLHMTSQAQLKAKPAVEGLSLVCAQIPQYQVNRFLYEYVGGPWHWTDKLTLSDDQWRDYASDPRLHTWVAYYHGSVAGYFELYAHGGGDTEIAYFGLAPDFIGKGLGGHCLSVALLQAWQIAGTERVFVHTCTLDHPGALANYQARGMQIYQTQVEAIDDGAA